MSLLLRRRSLEGSWKGLPRGLKEGLGRVLEGSWKDLARGFHRPCEGWRYSGRERAKDADTTGDRSFLGPTRFRGGGSSAPQSSRRFPGRSARRPAPRPRIEAATLGAPRCRIRAPSFAVPQGDGVGGASNGLLNKPLGFAPPVLNNGQGETGV